jgi:hypothetical protein
MLSSVQEETWYISISFCHYDLSCLNLLFSPPFLHGSRRYNGTFMKVRNVYTYHVKEKSCGQHTQPFASTTNETEIDVYSSIPAYSNLVLTHPPHFPPWTLSQCTHVQKYHRRVTDSNPTVQGIQHVTVSAGTALAISRIQHVTNIQTTAR